MTNIHALIDVPEAVIDVTGASCLTSLIDADSLIYIVGYNNRDVDDTEIVSDSIDQFIHDILVKNRARQFAGFFSDKITFRHQLYPEYKANRREIDPGIAKWKPYIIEYCMQMWHFDLIDNLEADDAVACLQLHMQNTTICSPDKDLRQIPGNHFDYKKNQKIYISEEEGVYNWAYQMLVGDSGDNIKGLPGCGKVGAEKHLFGVDTSLAKDVVEAQYLLKFGNDASYKLHCDLIGMGHTVQPKYSALHTFDLDKTIILDYLGDPDFGDAEDIFGSG